MPRKLPKRTGPDAAAASVREVLRFTCVALAGLVVAMLAGAPRAAAASDRASLVNPLVGTAIGAPAIGQAAGAGNTVPGAATPFGTVQWSPDTLPTAAQRTGGYAYEDDRLKGFSLTHISGVGCPVFGDAPFLPVPRAVTRVPDIERDAPRFSHRHEHAEPGSYALITRDGVRTDLTATARSGAGRFTFPARRRASVLRQRGRQRGGRRRRAAPRRPRPPRDLGHRRERGVLRLAQHLPAPLGRPLLAALRELGHVARGPAVAGRADGPGRPRAGPRRRLRVVGHAAYAHGRGPRRDLVHRSRRSAAQPDRERRQAAGPRAPLRAPRLERRAVVRSRRRRAPRGPPDLHHRALPLAAAPERLLRRGRPLRRDGRQGPPPRPRARAVRQRLGLGHLPHGDPAPGHDRAAAGRRHRRLARARRPRERLPAALAGRQRPDVGDGRRPERADHHEHLGPGRARLRPARRPARAGPRRHADVPHAGGVRRTRAARRLPAPGLGAARALGRRLRPRLHAVAAVGERLDDARVRARRLRDRPCRGGLARRPRDRGALRPPRAGNWRNVIDPATGRCTPRAAATGAFRAPAGDRRPPTASPRGPPRSTRGSSRRTPPGSSGGSAASTRPAPAWTRSSPDQRRAGRLPRLLGNEPTLSTPCALPLGGQARRPRASCASALLGLYSPTPAGLPATTTAARCRRGGSSPRSGSPVPGTAT